MKQVTELKLHHLNLLLLLAAFPVISQAQDTTAGAPGTTTSAVPTKPSPAPPPAEKKKPKKVWTNDEISTVKGSVSVVGEQNFSDADPVTKTPSHNTGQERLRQQQISYYRDQIQQLQGQIEAAGKRISQLRNFKGENTAPSGGINPSHGYNMVPLEDQVKQLEERKKQLQAKIQDVENDAKKNGLEPGDLR